MRDVRGARRGSNWACAIGLALWVGVGAASVNDSPPVSAGPSVTMVATLGAAGGTMTDYQVVPIREPGLVVRRLPLRADRPDEAARDATESVVAHPAAAFGALACLVLWIAGRRGRG